ncbi:MAG: hypothetical protein M3O25_07055, partial [Actinomycetota bacterium]|nr:hypothetical protein [Actinomycetota bacterium]
NLMSTVIDLSISLDGFVADADDEIEHVFDWYQGGKVEVQTAAPEHTARPVKSRTATVASSHTPAPPKGKIRVIPDCAPGADPQGLRADPRTDELSRRNA